MSQINEKKLNPEMQLLCGKNKSWRNRRKLKKKQNNDGILKDSFEFSSNSHLFLLLKKQKEKQLAYSVKNLYNYETKKQKNKKNFKKSKKCNCQIFFILVEKNVINQKIESLED